MKKVFVRVLSILVLMIMMAISVDSFIYNGYVRNSTGSYAGNANVSVVGINYTMTGPQSRTWSILTNSTGFFNLTVSDETYMGYRPQIMIYDASNNVLEVGPILPDFPIEVYQMGLNESTLTTEAAVTFNISANNGSAPPLNNVSFGGMVMDKKLGMPISEWSNENSKLVYAPADRNYTITWWGQTSPPRTLQMTNISSYSNPKVINLSQNMSTTMFRFAGTGNVTGNTSGVNFTAFYLYAFPGNNVQMDNAFYHQMDWDNIDTATGNFNISIMGPNIEMLVVILANNSNEFFMGLKNVSLSANSTDNHITLRKLAGSFYSATTLNTSMTAINVVTAGTNSNVTGAFTKAYATFDDIPVYFMSQPSTGSAVYFPFWTTVTPKVSVFSQSYAPREKRITPSLLSTNTTVNIGLYMMNITDSSGAKVDVTMDFYTSNSTCDVALPPSGCLISNFDDDSFNPMQAMLGGSVSLRLNQSSLGIVVHYVNVDLLASGPPDAAFDTSSTATTSGSAIDEAWKFGSRGPTVYDYVLIQTPYADTAFDDSQAISIALTKLYDEDWNTVWDTTLNGTSVTLSDYSDYNAAWFTGMTCSLTSSLASQGCYVDTTNNKIWMRVPHFSGIGPKVSGTKPSSAAAAAASTTSGHSGGGSVASGAAVAGAASVYVYSGEIDTGDKISFKIGSAEYKLKLDSIDSQRAKISFEGYKDFSLANGVITTIDINNDGKNDVSVKATYVDKNTAKLSIKTIAVEQAAEAAAPAVNETEKKPQESLKAITGENLETPETPPKAQETGKTYNIMGGIVALAAIAALVALFVVRARRKKQQI